MENFFNTMSITGLASALSECMDIALPMEASDPLKPLCRLVSEKSKSGKAQKVLIYNPDAIGMWLYQRYTSDFAPVLKHTQLALPIITVMPSVTPVCFASMYTGALPDVHNIKQYEKPVLTCDTLFDALLRAGKKAAIVAVDGSSMAKIFAGRQIDYYILPYDDDVTIKTLELIKLNQYDFIAVYHQEYDDVMHRTHPESMEALQAMRNNIDSFDQFAKAAKESWAGYDTLLAFATDHGIHTNEDGHGIHGQNIPSDMNIMHFYGIHPASPF